MSSQSVSATPTDPTIIELSKTYRFPDEVNDKIEEWGRKLWRLLRENIEFETPQIFRNREEFQYLAERLTNYALARLITRGMIAEKDTIGLPEDVRNAAFAQAVEDVLDVTEFLRDSIAWYLGRICSRIRKNGIKQPVFCNFRDPWRV